MHAKEIKATPPEKIILQVEPISVRIEQAAEMMGTSEDTLRKWIRKAGFPRRTAHHRTGVTNAALGRREHRQND